MAGYESSMRCSNCGINHPMPTPKCAKCGEPNSFISGQKPHTLAEIKAMAKSAEDKDTDGTLRMDKVQQWRFSQLLKYGLDLDRAQVGAILKHIDIEEFRALRTNGCPALTAWEIVR